MSIFITIIGIILIIYLINLWLKIRRVKSATRQYILSLGGIEIIFAPLIEKIENVFACDRVISSWDNVIVCNAPNGASSFRSNIAFRLTRTLTAYVITYTSTGKSLPQMIKTWSFSESTSLERMWLFICDAIGISPEVNEQKVKESTIPENSSPEIPILSDTLVKFNFIFSFDILPKRIVEYTNGSREFIDVLSPIGIPEEYQEYFDMIDSSHLICKSNSDIELMKLCIPSNGSTGEVKYLLIIRNKVTRKAKLYSLEYSIDNEYCVCSVTPNTHGNLGFISSETDFIKFCEANFEVDKISPSIQSSPVDKVHVVSVTPLMEFANKFGKMKVCDFVNSKTGEPFKACAFVGRDGNVTIASFGSLLTCIDTGADKKQLALQIAEHKNILQIVELSTGVYKLTQKNP